MDAVEIQFVSEMGRRHHTTITTFTHLNEAPVGVVDPAGVPALLDQRRRHLVVHAQGKHC